MSDDDAAASATLHVTLSLISPCYVVVTNFQMALTFPSLRQVKGEKMAESTGVTAATAPKLLASPSISVSCNGSKASAGSVAPYPFGSSVPPSGSNTSTGGLRASTGCRASKRLKCASASAIVASLPVASQAQAWAAATAAPSGPRVQRTTSLPSLPPPSCWRRPSGVTICLRRLAVSASGRCG